MTKLTVAGNAYRWAHPAIEQMVGRRPAAALDFLQTDATTKHYVALTVRGSEAHQVRFERVLQQLAGDIFSRPRPSVLAEMRGTGLGKLSFLKRVPSVSASAKFHRSWLNPPPRRRLASRDRRFADLYGAFPVKWCFWFVGAGRPVFVPSPAISLPERAEGVKGPKRLAQLGVAASAALVFRSVLTPEHAKG